MMNSNAKSLPTSNQLSPNHSDNGHLVFSKPSTIDNASLEELDRIMDTLSTLSRSTSFGRPKKDRDNSNSISPLSNGTPRNGFSLSPASPQSPTSPTSSTNSPYLPPRMTSPVITPLVQSPTRYAPSNFERKSLKGDNKQPAENTSSHGNFAGNNQVRSRYPSEYENASVLQEPPRRKQGKGKFSSSPYEHIVPDVPNNITATNHPDGNSNSRYFYGPLPMSPRATKRDSDVNIRTDKQQIVRNEEAPRKMSYQSFANMGQDPYGTARAEFGSNRNNTPGFPRASVDYSQSNSPKKEYNTIDRELDNPPIPRYNDKKSYLSNLENGTLPRSKLDVQRQNDLETKRNRKSCEIGADMYSKNSFSRRKKKTLRAGKPPSRQSRSSFTSYSENGRCYASVSTAPANSIMNTGIFQTNKDQSEADILGKPSVPKPKTCSDDSLCLKCGRYLHMHLFEMFILATFCAAMPLGIILQAMNLSETSVFKNYISFFGRDMVLNMLSTLTPITVFLSVLSSTAAMPLQTFKKISLLMLIFYVLIWVVAACLSAGVILTLKPGVTPTNISTSSLNVTNNQFYYHNSEVRSASDEVILFFRMVLPGFGNPHVGVGIGTCNLFVLVLLALVLGCTIAASGPEGKILRSIISRIGILVVKMNSILFWYLPIGILISMSEFWAMRIDWADIGHDKQSMDIFINNISHPNIIPYGSISLFNEQLKSYIFCALLTLAVFGIILLPILVAIATRSNPFSPLRVRSLAPLLVSYAIGFSDICIPLTSRCFYKERKITENSSNMCRMPVQGGVDVRLGQFSSTFSGIFIRPGSLILITCSSLFYAQACNATLTPWSVTLACFSAIVMSIVTISGKWYNERNPYFQSMAIVLTSAGISSYSYFPRLLFCMWILCRFAAAVDILADLYITYLVNHICKKELGKVIDLDTRRCSDAVSSAETKVTVLPTPKLSAKSPPINVEKANSSDYDDAPLLFNKYYEGNGSGESGSDEGREQNNEVFYPSTSTTVERNQKLVVQQGSDKQQHNTNSNNNTPIHSNSGGLVISSENPVALTRYKLNTDQQNQAAINNREETSFVTF